MAYFKRSVFYIEASSVEFNKNSRKEEKWWIEIEREQIDARNSDKK